MDPEVENKLLELQAKLANAERERDHWAGKPTERHKMACIMVDCYRKEIASLLSGNKQPDA